MKYALHILFFLQVCIASSQTAHDLYLSAITKDSIKDYTGALTDIDKALSITKDNDSLHILHAKIEAESSNFKEAYAEINEVIKHNSNYFDAYMLRGIIKAKLGNYEGAVHDFTKGLKLNPGSIKAYYNRGLAHAYLDEVKLCDNDFSKVIELDSTYINGWFQRGYWREINGDVEGSLKDLNKASQLNPNDKEILLSLGIANYKLHKKEEACIILNEAKAKGSSTAEELINIMCK
ncbi:MAG TPA: tetratricopeptide repeat protein [Bacteroidia bacterium]|nr:tetratricopeptide repeat protein [Bacteroidia bacterium]